MADISRKVVARVRVKRGERGGVGGCGSGCGCDWDWGWVEDICMWDRGRERRRSEWTALWWRWWRRREEVVVVEGSAREETKANGMAMGWNGIEANVSDGDAAEMYNN